MDIDIKELEAFSSVVEKGSFSRAAHALYLTQPTVSAHIASLERKLGVRLLVRTTKEIYPSDAGKLLYEYAREILRLRSGAVQAIKAFSGELRGTVTIAATATAEQYILPALIRDFRAAYPNIRFDICVPNGSEVAEHIVSRKAEIGFTTAPINLPKCLYHELGTDHLVLAVPNTPPYQAMLSTGFPIHRLAGETFIIREEGSRTRREADAFLEESGMDLRSLNVAVEVHTNSSACQMVSEGLGVSILPAVTCEDYRRFGKLLTFSFDSALLLRKLYLLRHKNSIFPPATQVFFDFVTKQEPAPSQTLTE